MTTHWKIFSAALLVLSLSGSLQAEGEPMKVSSAEAMKAATSKPSPTYPTVAKQLKVEGEVQVQVVIGEEGKVEEATVVTGHPLLNKAALETAREWKFTPFKNNGKKVKARAVLTIPFKI